MGVFITAMRQDVLAGYGRLVGLNGKIITRLLNGMDTELQERSLPDPSKSSHVNGSLRSPAITIRPASISQAQAADLMKLEGLGCEPGYRRRRYLSRPGSSQQVPPVGEASSAQGSRLQCHNRLPGHGDPIPCPQGPDL